MDNGETEFCIADTFNMKIANLIIISLSLYCAIARVFAANIDSMESGFAIDRWLVVGPFRLHEDARSATQPGYDPRDKLPNASDMGIPGELKAEVIRYNYINGISDFSISNALGFGAQLNESFSTIVFDVEVMSDCDRYLSIDNQDWGEVFINGEVVAVIVGGKNNEWTPSVVLARLKKGSNRVGIITKHRRGHTAQISVWISCYERDAQKWLDGLSEVEILSPLLSATSKEAVIKAKIRSDSRRFSIHLADCAGNKIKELSIGRDFLIKTDDLKIYGDGLYRIGVSINDLVITSDVFVVGDHSAIYHDLVRTIKKREGDDDKKLRLLAIERRWRALETTEMTSLEDPRWQKKVAHTLVQLQNLKAQTADFPGTTVAERVHIVGFISSIDGGSQFYRLYCPQKTVVGGLPLIVILPNVASANRAFVESVYMANQQDAETIGKIADRLGVCIVWPGYRSRPWANPSDFAHLDEVLSHARSFIDIDERRVYLWANCAGGMLAIAELARTERYAAAVLVNPYYRKASQVFDGTFPWSRFPAYGKWINIADPVEEYIKRSEKVPLLIFCDDGAEVGHGEYIHTARFIEDAKAENYHPIVERGSRYFDTFRFEQGAGWLLGIQRKCSSPAAKDWPTSPHFKLGPILRVFERPFLVVVGTKGSNTDTEGNSVTAKRFEDAWQRNHFSTCVIIADTQVDDQMLDAYNFILIGNQDTNLLWQRAVNSTKSTLPISVNRNGIVIRGKKWGEDTFCIQAVIPSPWSSKHSLILLGGRNLLNSRFGTLNLAGDGWYDVALWRTEGRLITLIEADHWKDGDMK